MAKLRKNKSLNQKLDLLNFKHILISSQAECASRAWQISKAANWFAHHAIRGRQQAFERKVRLALRAADLSSEVQLTPLSDLPGFGTASYRGQKLHVPSQIIDGYLAFQK